MSVHVLRRPRYDNTPQPLLVLGYYCARAEAAAAAAAGNGGCDDVGGGATALAAMLDAITCCPVQRAKRAHTHIVATDLASHSNAHRHHTSRTMERPRCLRVQHNDFTPGTIFTLCVVRSGCLFRAASVVNNPKTVFEPSRETPHTKHIKFTKSARGDRARASPRGDARTPGRGGRS